VTRVRAQEFGAHSIETQTQKAQTLAQNLIRGAGFLVRVGPGVHQGPNRLVTGRVTGGHLIVVGGGTTADAGETHAIRTGLIELDGGEIGHTIRSNVLRGIADLVEQLLFD